MSEVWTSLWSSSCSLRESESLSIKHNFYPPFSQDTTLFQVAEEGPYHYSFFIIIITTTTTLRELWTECASTSVWDCCSWRARWPVTAARARPWPSRTLLQLRPAGTHRWTWGWCWSWDTWRTAGVTWARKRKPRSRRGRGPSRRDRRIYATWKQPEGSRRLVSDSFGMGVTTPRRACRIIFRTTAPNCFTYFAIGL